MWPSFVESDFTAAQLILDEGSKHKRHGNTTVPPRWGRGQRSKQNGAVMMSVDASKVSERAEILFLGDSGMYFMTNGPKVQFKQRWQRRAPGRGASEGVCATTGRMSAPLAQTRAGVGSTKGAPRSRGQLPREPRGAADNSPAWVMSDRS